LAVVELPEPNLTTDETARINQNLATEFSKVNPEEWK
jgi:hypothetical protein